jgi:hypothetical protein
MIFKKFNLWSTEEDNIIKDNFFIMPFNSHAGSRFILIQNKLLEKSFNRTIKSISRRSYRLGLKSYIPTLKYVEVICSKCISKYLKAEKYINRDTINICLKCQKTNNGYKNIKQKLEYHKHYMKTWRKTK